MNSKIIYELSISFYNKVVVLNFDLQSTLVNLALQEIKVNKYQMLVLIWKELTNWEGQM